MQESAFIDLTKYTHLLLSAKNTEIGEKSITEALEVYETISSYTVIFVKIWDFIFNLRNTEDFYILKGNTAFQPKSSFHLTESGPDSQLLQLSGKKGNFYYIYWYLTLLILKSEYFSKPPEVICDLKGFFIMGGC